MAHAGLPRVSTYPAKRILDKAAEIPARIISFPLRVLLNYNAGVFVILVCCGVLLNCGFAVYLLAWANLERWKIILLTGYHSQFEDSAWLAGLASWLLIRRGSPAPRRLAFAAELQGVPLSIKHILFLFPIWVLFWPKLGGWRKRMGNAVIAYGVFGLSFFPCMRDPASRAGIYHNLLHYRAVFSLSLGRFLTPAHPLAFGSIALVLVILPVKSLALHWAVPAALMVGR